MFLPSKKISNIVYHLYDRTKKAVEQIGNGIQCFPAAPQTCGVLFETQLTSLSLSLPLCEIGTTYKCLQWRKTCVRYVLFGINVAFKTVYVISRRCMFARGWSMFTFIVLPHWSIIPLTFDMIPQPVLALPRKSGSVYSIDWAIEVWYTSDIQCITHLCFTQCFAMSCL